MIHKQFTKRYYYFLDHQQHERNLSSRLNNLVKKLDSMQIYLTLIYLKGFLTQF